MGFYSKFTILIFVIGVLVAEPKAFGSAAGECVLNVVKEAVVPPHSQAEVPVPLATSPVVSTPLTEKPITAEDFTQWVKNEPGVKVNQVSTYDHSYDVHYQTANGIWGTSAYIPQTGAVAHSFQMNEESIANAARKKLIAENPQLVENLKVMPGQTQLVLTSDLSHPETFHEVAHELDQLRSTPNGSTYSQWAVQKVFPELTIAVKEELSPLKAQLEEVVGPVAWGEGLPHEWPTIHTQEGAVFGKELNVTVATFPSAESPVLVQFNFAYPDVARVLSAKLAQLNPELTPKLVLNGGKLVLRAPKGQVTKDFKTILAMVKDSRVHSPEVDRFFWSYQKLLPKEYHRRFELLNTRAKEVESYFGKPKWVHLPNEWPRFDITLPDGRIVGEFDDHGRVQMTANFFNSAPYLEKASYKKWIEKKLGFKALEDPDLMLYNFHDNPSAIHHFRAIRDEMNVFQKEETHFLRSQVESHVKRLKGQVSPSWSSKKLYAKLDQDYRLYAGKPLTPAQEREIQEKVTSWMIPKLDEELTEAGIPHVIKESKYSPGTQYIELKLDPEHPNPVTALTFLSDAKVVKIDPADNLIHRFKASYNRPSQGYYFDLELAMNGTKRHEVRHGLHHLKALNGVDTIYNSTFYIGVPYKKTPNADYWAPILENYKKIDFEAYERRNVFLNKNPYAKSGLMSEEFYNHVKDVQGVGREIKGFPSSRASYVELESYSKGFLSDLDNVQSRAMNYEGMTAGINEATPLFVQHVAGLNRDGLRTMIKNSPKDDLGKFQVHLDLKEQGHYYFDVVDAKQNRLMNQIAAGTVGREGIEEFRKILIQRMQVMKANANRMNSKILDVVKVLQPFSESRANATAFEQKFISSLNAVDMLDIRSRLLKNSELESAYQNLELRNASWEDVLKLKLALKALPTSMRKDINPLLDLLSKAQTHHEKALRFLQTDDFKLARKKMMDLGEISSIDLNPIN